MEPVPEYWVVNWIGIEGVDARYGMLKKRSWPPLSPLQIALFAGAQLVTVELPPPEEDEEVDTPWKAKYDPAPTTAMTITMMIAAIAVPRPRVALHRPRPFQLPSESILISPPARY